MHDNEFHFSTSFDFRVEYLQLNHESDWENFENIVILFGGGFTFSVELLV